MTKQFDFLIVGAGLFGSVCARELTNKGFRCLVIDKRDHIAGNCYTQNVEDICVHKYGAHIFHTSNKQVWDYVNSFVEFNRFTNSPIANYQGKIYNLPFNMNTFYQLWGVKTPEEAKMKIAEQRAEYVHIKEPKNLEEQALVLVGHDIYETLIKGYTEKQWGRKANDLPAFIIKRLPLRFTYDNNYFNDNYQGIPIGGYTKFIELLLRDSKILLNTDYFEHKADFDSFANKIVYTGKIDEFYNYCFGKLEYRSLIFKHETLNMENYQGNAVVNYTEDRIPYTRIIEHKHFEFGSQPKTIITKEYSKEWEDGDIPYYPINDKKNNDIYQKYKSLANKEENIIFGGRLAEYKYFDMHQIIASALTKLKEITHE